VARGVQAALWLAIRPSDWRIAACADLIEDCVRHRDEWAGCLLTGLVGAAHAVVGREDLALPLLRRAAERAELLGAPVLRLWAEALATVAAPGDADAESDADLDTSRLVRSAESLGLESVTRLLDRGVLPSWSWSSPAVEGPPASAPHAVTAPETSGQEPEPSSESTVQLHCLGAFAVLVNGATLPWGGLRPRARALLMMLALRSGQPIHREELMAAIWPEASNASGTRSLQVAVSSARQWLVAAGLGEDSLPRHGDAYVLDLPGARVDVQRFEELARAAGPRNGLDGPAALAAQLAALEAYCGDLLPELGPADWVVTERDRLRTLAARLGADAAQTALGLGDWSAGIAAARRSIDLDPYHDPAWQALAELLDQAGDHSAAVVARREHARVCEELGVPVS
jgi:DNA-binding SARP family transcriptional activator